MTMPLAITFDWYGTLADHRDGIGRRRRFVAYLASRGLKADPWDGRILYDVFDYYADGYRPNSSDQEKRSFWIEFTRLFFERANVNCTPNAAQIHADSIRDIFGPGCFCLFSDVRQTLSGLKGRGVRLGVISNWQRGLNHFCAELDIAPYFDAIISSAEVGYEKPDARIFKEALTQLKVPPEHTLHVGDSINDDFNGATEAG
jgi:FMN phosphatase YigB (HAD superfamily)